MGDIPDWYILLRVSDRLHCPPWELLERPIAWYDIGSQAIAAEAHAEKIHRKRGRRSN